MSFVPSAYQQTIFEHMAALSDNKKRRSLQINAVAGSGKTTTITEGLKRLPTWNAASVLLCAFNVEIRDTLQRKVEFMGLDGVTVKTNHGIGMGALYFHFGRGGNQWKPSVDTEGAKYLNLVASYWLFKGYRDEQDKLTDAELEMVKLCHFARVCLIDPTNLDAVVAMADAYEIELPEPDRMLNGLATVLGWGVDGMPEPDRYGRTFSAQECIDFDDMIWLPWRLELSLRKYRTVLVDECQDLSNAQRWLVTQSVAEGGLFLAVGDPRQAIYAFAGASADSFAKITEETNAEVLPLSICYRCPKSVIRLAQEIVSEIEAAPDAPEGTVDYLTHKTFLLEVNRKDMVLCRVTRDLIDAAFALIRLGKPAKVRGRDIGKSLIRTLDKVEKMRSFRFSEFVDFLMDYRDREAMSLRKKRNADTRIQLLDDRVNSLMAVYENTVGNGGTSIGELRAYIEELFADKGLGFIWLSTIHKAKGLEAERVFILREDLMPHPMATTPQALVQETNLRYVAITRSLSELFFVLPDLEKPNALEEEGRSLLAGLSRPQPGELEPAASL